MKLLMKMGYKRPRTFGEWLFGAISTVIFIVILTVGLVSILIYKNDPFLQDYLNKTYRIDFGESSSTIIMKDEFFDLDEGHKTEEGGRN